MSTKQAWFSSNELTLIDGLPSTIQGINQKARRESWQSRIRKGVQGGKALEYHIDSLPRNAKNFLTILEDTTPYNMAIKSDPFRVWLEAYNQLTSEEKALVSSWLIRHGVTELVSFIKQVKFENVE